MSDSAPTPKSRRARRQFTDEFRAGAVRLVIDEHGSIAQVARGLDLTESALRLWVDRARADRGKGRPGVLTTAEREERSKLRKENRELRMERDILKKSRGSFNQSTQRRQ
jgi:transposase